jgi:hypothetical protein
MIYSILKIFFKFPGFFLEKIIHSEFTLVTEEKMGWLKAEAAGGR